MVIFFFHSVLFIIFLLLLSLNPGVPFNVLFWYCLVSLCCSTKSNSCVNCTFGKEILIQFWFKQEFQTEGAFSSAFPGWTLGTTSCDLDLNAALVHIKSLQLNMIGQCCLSKPYALKLPQWILQIKLVIKPQTIKIRKQFRSWRKDWCGFFFLVVVFKEQFD